MYKSASKFMKSQPVSRFFRDHLNVSDTQEIVQKRSVMQWIWDSTKRKGLRYVLSGVSDYELVLLFLSLFDEERLDLRGVILAEQLVERFSGGNVQIDGQLREEIMDGIARAYDKFRMR